MQSKIQTEKSIILLSISHIFRRYISPIYFADNGQYQYFYAGNGDKISLYVLSLETSGMVTKKIKDISFSLKEITEGKYIGNGMIEYMIL